MKKTNNIKSFGDFKLNEDFTKKSYDDKGYRYRKSEILDAIEKVRNIEGYKRFQDVEFDNFIEEFLHELGIRDKWASMDQQEYLKTYNEKIEVQEEPDFTQLDFTPAPETFHEWMARSVEDILCDDPKEFMKRLVDKLEPHVLFLTRGVFYVYKDRVIMYLDETTRLSPRLWYDNNTLEWFLKDHFKLKQKDRDFLVKWTVEERFRTHIADCMSGGYDQFMIYNSKMGLNTKVNWHPEK